ncbi:MAG: BlaI/MecI/CopY family transcriptional regulator, partial [Pseudomonadota bacterium]|nr:BlaI/MecI/CopY family transcriptional regulator [Pseudomonadota bacterium]
IQESSAGLDAGELQQLLDVKSVKPMLTQLFQKELLSRETVEGRFVYFPSRKNSQRKQQKQRREIDQKKKEALALLPLENIIALLVEIIRRPKNTPRQWAHRLTQQGIRIATSDIRLVLDHYGIDPKKGLLNF